MRTIDFIAAFLIGLIAGAVWVAASIDISPSVICMEARVRGVELSSCESEAAVRELSVYDVISAALRKDAAGDPRSRLSVEARKTLGEMLEDMPREEEEPIAGYVVKGLRLRVERER